MCEAWADRQLEGVYTKFFIIKISSRINVFKGTVTLTARVNYKSQVCFSPNIENYMSGSLEEKK